MLSILIADKNWVSLFSSSHYLQTWTSSSQAVHGGLMACFSLHVALLLPGYSWPTALDKKAFHITSLNTPSLGSDRLEPTCHLHVLRLCCYSFQHELPKVAASQPHLLAIPFPSLSLPFPPFLLSPLLIMTAANFVADSIY